MNASNTSFEITSDSCPTRRHSTTHRRRDVTDPATERIRATWTAGDFGRIAVGYAPGAAEFIARLDLAHGERVLDVACGTGNLALPAARAGANTTGIDIAPNLIAQAIESAAAEGISARFDVGDAEELPYADGSFDTVVSMFGAMFAARPTRAAAELLRVTRSGGRIAMANWTPTGFIGQMLRIIVALRAAAARLAVGPAMGRRNHRARAARRCRTNRLRPPAHRLRVSRVLRRRRSGCFEIGMVRPCGRSRHSTRNGTRDSSTT